jgi:hypothetical protein
MEIDVAAFPQKIEKELPQGAPQFEVALAIS